MNGLTSWVSDQHLMGLVHVLALRKSCLNAGLLDNPVTLSTPCLLSISST